ncbi:MAG: hypothetical protein MJY94_00430 [Bacteroidales bacterium]|nr:hypothetical protein [Bacteroidales bacterium]
MKNILRLLYMIIPVLCLAGCKIEPPLHLPAQEVMVDMPMVLTDMEVVWDLDINWNTAWHYGWDDQDIYLFGETGYPEPTSFEVRRYFLGEHPNVPHTTVDAFTVFGNSFRRAYEFGYYDMLIWSNIDSEDGAQVVVIDESDLDAVKATTTVTRGMTRLAKESSTKVTAVHNQPEIFYSAYPQNIYISRNREDYDYYNEEEDVWVKVINTKLRPLVYIYLVQVILLNNEDGRVKDASGNAALSAMANSTSVNTGHTAYDPCIVYFNTRMKKDIILNDPDSPYHGQKADIIGGKLTTYGLCDMDSFMNTKAKYSGSRPDLPNYLYVDLTFSNDTQETLQFTVTDQCQEQSHGGIITIYIDCHDLKVPEGEGGSSGSLFVPVVEDYNEISYEIPM